MRRLHAVLHKALNDAAKQDLVAFSVASKATLPERDIHLDERTLRRFLTQKRAYLKAPKTNRPRTISIDASTVAALRARRRDQAAHKLAWPGERVNDWGLVFTREDGRWINAMQLTDAFRKADLPPYRRFACTIMPTPALCRP